MHSPPGVLLAGVASSSRISAVSTAGAGEIVRTRTRTVTSTGSANSLRSPSGSSFQSAMRSADNVCGGGNECFILSTVRPHRRSAIRSTRPDWKTSDPSERAVSHVPQSRTLAISPASGRRESRAGVQLVGETMMEKDRTGTQGIRDTRVARMLDRVNLEGCVAERPLVDPGGDPPKPVPVA